MKPLQIVDAKDVVPQTRVSPVTALLNDIEGDYLTMRQTAQKVDVHIETLRRLCRTSRVNAPSKAVTRGSMVIYLFTPEDVQEVEDYFYGKDEQQADGARKHKKGKTDKVR